MEETGIPLEIADHIFFIGVRGLIEQILTRNREAAMPTIYPSSSSPSEVEEINETLDEQLENIEMGDENHGVGRV